MSAIIDEVKSSIKCKNHDLHYVWTKWHPLANPDVVPKV